MVGVFLAEEMVEEPFYYGNKHNGSMSGCFFVFSLIFFNLLAILCSMWDLSSLTRDKTQVPCIGSMES